MNTSYILYGHKVSYVVCTYEAEIRAKRLGLGSVPTKYSSTHFIINTIQIGKEIYNINKYKGVDRTKVIKREEIKEERMILEVSSILKKGEIEERHKHILEIDEKRLYALSLREAPYIKKNHITRLTKEGSRSILSYFVKTWADNISNIEAMSYEDEEFLNQSKDITPKEALYKVLPQIRIDIESLVIQ